MTGKSTAAGLGIAIGAAIGTAIGAALGNVGAWLAIGAGIGLLLVPYLGGKPSGACDKADAESEQKARS